MYNIPVHVPYEKQQYIKKMNHYITNAAVIAAEILHTETGKWHADTVLPGGT